MAGRSPATTDAVSPRADKTLRKEGWLWKWTKKKQRKRKWFVLARGTLSWYRQQGELTPLNTIAVHAARFKAQSGNEFTITATKHGREKDYSFAADHNDDTKAWVQAFVTVSRGKKVQLGWLTKDRKRFFFLLQDSVLYWFGKEVDPNADFRKSVLGSLKLLSCSVMDTVGELCFEIHDIVAKKGKPHCFEAKTVEEKRAWVEALQKDIAKHQQKILQQCERFGWLKLKESRRFFFVLAKGRLTWYKGSEDAEQRGSVVLDQCAVRREISKPRMFTVYSPTNSTILYTLSADTDDEATEWITALNNAAQQTANKAISNVDEVRSGFVNNQKRVEKSGWMLHRDRKRWMVLRGEVLMWFETQPREGMDPSKERGLEGTLNLKECSIARQEFTFTVKAPDNKLYAFQGVSKDESMEWVTAIKAGLEQARGIAYAQAKGTAIDPDLVSMYSSDLGKQGRVTRKGKDRFLVLEPALLKELTYPAYKLKESMRLEGCTVSVIDESSFLLRSLGESFVYECARGDTREWVNNISFYIIKANAAAETDIDKKGWLIMNGKRRWLALRLGKLYWFQQEMRGNQVAEIPKLKNCVELKDARFGVMAPSADRKYAFEVIAVGGKPTYEFRCDTEKELTDWVQALGVARDALKPQPNAPKTPVFGSDLVTLMAQEKEKAGGKAVVAPAVVRKLVEHLSQNCLKTPGLFQVPPNFQKIRDWVKAVNSGQTLELRDAAPHDVAGLLKQFFRLLPEPLYTYSRYNELLESRGDITLTRSIIDSLPPAHYDLAKYITQFFVTTTTNSDINGVDLSMIFAPLLMRRRLDLAPSSSVDDLDAMPDRPVEDPEEADVDLLKSVLVMGTMISNYEDLFEDPIRMHSTSDSMHSGSGSGRPSSITVTGGGSSPAPARKAGAGGSLDRVVSMANLDKLLNNLVAKDSTSTGKQPLAEQQDSAMRKYGLDLTVEEETRRSMRKQNAGEAPASTAPAAAAAASPAGARQLDMTGDNWQKNLKSTGPARKAIPEEFYKSPGSPGRPSATASLAPAAGRNVVGALTPSSAHDGRSRASSGSYASAGHSAGVAVTAPPSAVEGKKQPAYPAPKAKPADAPEETSTVRVKAAVGLLDDLLEDLELEKRSSVGGATSSPESGTSPVSTISSTSAASGNNRLLTVPGKSGAGAAGAGAGAGAGASASANPAGGAAAAAAAAALAPRGSSRNLDDLLDQLRAGKQSQPASPESLLVKFKAEKERKHHRHEKKEKKEKKDKEGKRESLVSTAATLPSPTAGAGAGSTATAAAGPNAARSPRSEKEKEMEKEKERKDKRDRRKDTGDDSPDGVAVTLQVPVPAPTPSSSASSALSTSSSAATSTASTPSAGISRSVASTQLTSSAPTTVASVSTSTSSASTTSSSAAARAASTPSTSVPLSTSATSAAPATSSTAAPSSSTASAAAAATAAVTASAVASTSAPPKADSPSRPPSTPLSTSTSSSTSTSTSTAPPTTTSPSISTSGRVLTSEVTETVGRVENIPRQPPPLPPPDSDSSPPPPLPLPFPPGSQRVGAQNSPTRPPPPPSGVIAVEGIAGAAGAVDTSNSVANGAVPKIITIAASSPSTAETATTAASTASTAVPAMAASASAVPNAAPTPTPPLSPVSRESVSSKTAQPGTPTSLASTSSSSSSPVVLPAGVARRSTTGSGVFDGGVVYAFPPVLHVRLNSPAGKQTVKQVPITPALTFEEVLKTIAKSKADEYELQNVEGQLLAGNVSHYFEGKSEATVVLQKCEIEL